MGIDRPSSPEFDKVEPVMTLEDFAQNVVDARQKLAKLKEEQAAIERQIQAQFGKALGRVDTEIHYANKSIKAAEETLRQVARATWRETGNKRPHQGVEIRVYKALSYDQETAKAYAMEHLPQVVKLDKRAFEKVAKVLDLDFVTIHDDPKVFISKSLGQ